MTYVGCVMTWQIISVTCVQTKPSEYMIKLVRLHVQKAMIRISNIECVTLIILWSQETLLIKETLVVTLYTKLTKKALMDAWLNNITITLWRIALLAQMTNVLDVTRIHQLTAPNVNLDTSLTLEDNVSFAKVATCRAYILASARIFVVMAKGILIPSVTMGILKATMDVVHSVQSKLTTDAEVGSLVVKTIASTLKLSLNLSK